MLLGCPSVVKANYVCYKLRRETRALWIRIKHSHGSKIDGILACRLLNSTVTSLNRMNSLEANDLNQGELIHFSEIIRF